MTSSRPYLIRAIYDWLLDNNKTPHLLVDTEDPEVFVPEGYAKDGRIVLNIDPDAIVELDISNEAVSFRARFRGVPHDIYVPIYCIKAIYCFENGRGMVFEEDDSQDEDDDDDNPPTTRGHKKSSRLAGNRKKPGRPHLKIVK